MLFQASLCDFFGLVTEAQVADFYRQLQAASREEQHEQDSMGRVRRASAASGPGPADRVSRRGPCAPRLHRPAYTPTRAQEIAPTGSLWTTQVRRSRCRYRPVLTGAAVRAGDRTATVVSVSAQGQSCCICGPDTRLEVQDGDAVCVLGPGAGDGSIYL